MARLPLDNPTVAELLRRGAERTIDYLIRQGKRFLEIIQRVRAKYGINEPNVVQTLYYHTVEARQAADRLERIPQLTRPISPSHIPANPSAFRGRPGANFLYTLRVLWPNLADGTQSQFTAMISSPTNLSRSELFELATRVWEGKQRHGIGYPGIKGVTSDDLIFEIDTIQQRG